MRSSTSPRGNVQFFELETGKPQNYLTDLSFLPSQVSCGSKGKALVDPSPIEKVTRYLPNEGRSCLVFLSPLFLPLNVECVHAHAKYVAAVGTHNLDLCLFLSRNPIYIYLHISARQYFVSKAKGVASHGLEAYEKAIKACVSSHLPNHGEVHDICKKRCDVRKFASCLHCKSCLYNVEKRIQRFNLHFFLHMSACVTRCVAGIYQTQVERGSKMPWSLRPKIKTQANSWPQILKGQKECLPISRKT